MPKVDVRKLSFMSLGMEVISKLGQVRFEWSALTCKGARAQARDFRITIGAVSAGAREGLGTKLDV